ncbi:peroxiredoxin family protein [Fontibacter flavus]|uniref:Peroxiredoxin family protein n=1 Tax=Fontibacter flavus TaxID=654838 RepID=A0ABV6FWS6_9BACT
MKLFLTFLTSISLVFLSVYSTPSISENEIEINLEKVPDFEVQTIDGQEVSLKKSIKEGKPTVVYLTASWCPMCAKNWPSLSEVYPEFKDKLNFVAVSIDPTDDATVMKKLVKEKNLTFPVAPGNPELMVKLGAKAQATTVGIDKNGNIQFMERAVMTADEFRKVFQSLIEA